MISILLFIATTVEPDSRPIGSAVYLTIGLFLTLFIMDSRHSPLPEKAKRWNQRFVPIISALWLIFLLSTPGRMFLVGQDYFYKQLYLHLELATITTLAFGSVFGWRGTRSTDKTTRILSWIVAPMFSLLAVTYGMLHLLSNLSNR